MPKFSIIIPVYNVMPFLEQCVTSVLSQTYADFEVILVDDGSTDGSDMLCDELSVGEQRLKVIHKKNGGSSSARNAGIDLATGEYVVFLDSDDFWNSSDVLSIIASRLANTQAQVLSFNYIKSDGATHFSPYFGSIETMPLDTNDTFQYMVNHDLWIACAWNKAIQRSLFNNSELRFVEGITAEDIDWSIRLAMTANKFDYINDVIVCYRQRESSVSQNITIQKVTTLMDNIDMCLMLIKESNNQDKAHLLKPFVSYQYGTALVHLAALPKSDERDELLARAGRKQHLLRRSKNWKIKFLARTTSLGGFQFTLWLLKMRNSR